VCFDAEEGGAPVGRICLDGDAVGVPVESSDPGLKDFDFWIFPMRPWSPCRLLSSM